MFDKIFPRMASLGLIWLPSYGLLFTMLLLASTQDSPSIRPFSFPSGVKLGDKASATCITQGDSGPWTFKWLKDGHELTPNKITKIVEVDGVMLLVINPIEQDSQGNYTCVANGPSGTQRFSAVLKVEAPPQWIEQPQDTYGGIGETITIPCLAKGTPTPKTTWKRITGESKSVETVVTQTTQHTVHPNGSLTFQHVKPDIAGDYLCEVANGIGNNLKAKISFTVRGEQFGVLRVLKASGMK